MTRTAWSREIRVGDGGYVLRVERQYDSCDKTYQNITYYDSCLVIAVCDNGDPIVVVEQWCNGHRQVTRRVPADSFRHDRE